MKVGRFTITNLTESDKSDVSEDAKTFRSPEDSAEIKIKVEKESLDFQSKSVNKTECFRNFQKKSSIQDTLSSNYADLVVSHQEFLLDFLKKDAERQEIMQGYIREIVELSEKNSVLEYENMQLNKALKKKG